VDIADLQMFVRENLPEDSILRCIILAESRTLQGVEYLAKLEVWLSLLRLEDGSILGRDHSQAQPSWPKKWAD